MGKLLFRLSLAAVVLLASVLVALIVRARQAGEALVDEVHRLSAPRPRPVHRVPAEGTTYGACLGPLLDQNGDAGVFGFGAPDEMKEALAAVLEGGRAIDALPAKIQADLAAVTPWLDQALACTRAPATCGDAAGLGPFAGGDGPRETTPFDPSAQARIAGLAMRADLARGKPGRALARCADALAVLRDGVSERGLIGVMHASAGVKDLMQPCGAAIDSADATAQRQFVDELGLIRTGFLTFAQLMELDRVQMQLIAYGSELTGDQRARLPPNAQNLAAANPVSTEWDVKRLVAWLSWPAVDARARRLEVAAAASPDRDRELRKVEEEGRLLSWTVPEWTSPPGTWPNFAQRYDARARGLDLLESAARVSLGEPPLPGVDVATRDGSVFLAVSGVGEPATLTLRLRARPSK